MWLMPQVEDALQPPEVAWFDSKDSPSFPNSANGEDAERRSMGGGTNHLCGDGDWKAGGQRSV